MLVSQRVRRQLHWYDALPSGWFAAWLGMLVGFCHIMFPVSVDESPDGIHWPTEFGNSCDGGMLRLSLPPLQPDLVRSAPWSWPYKTVAELDTLRYWQDITFTGAPITDFFAFASTINAVKACQAEASCQSGVRIYFQSRATFSSLVSTVDMLDIFGRNQYYYWLALKSSPLIVYYVVYK